MSRALTLCVLAVMLGMNAGHPRLLAAPPDDAAKLEREIELLKKENELLKKENELLKRELELAKTSPSRPATGETGERKGAKTTLDGIEYEFLSLRMNGNQGVLRVAVTSKQGEHRLLGQLPIRFLTKDGVEHRSPTPTTSRPTKIIEGVRQEVEFKAGRIPTSVAAFATIILPGTGGGRGFGAAEQNPVILKGEFAIER